MKIPQAKTSQSMLLIIILLSFFSCSKDSDILADYVVTDSNIALVEVKVVTIINESVLIEPHTEGVETAITGVTQPAMGTTVINEDNTITYTPNSDSTGTDEFDYSTAEQTGSITVTTVSNRADFWKVKFETEWTRSLPHYTKESTGLEPSKKQRRYYDHHVTDGLIAMIQATGDLNYVDDMVWYVTRVKNLAIKSNDGYYDWPVSGVNYQLYEAHGWRNIFKFLWLAKKYPAIKARLTTSKYNEWLSWFTTNLWDKWVFRGNGLVMRGLTHMASHMSSNMALYLYLLEDDQTKKNEYLSWVNAWNDDVDSKQDRGGANGTGFRDQLRTASGRYVWANSWGNKTGYTDIAHANAEVQSVINQFHQGIGDWTEGDIGKFTGTINTMMDASPDSDFARTPFRISAIYPSGDDRPFLHYGWVNVG